MDGRGKIHLNGGGRFHPAAVAEGMIVLITPGGAVSQAADEIAFPDGMAATPDDSTLIIAESFCGRLTAYDIVTDGRLSNRACGPRCSATGSASTPRGGLGSGPDRRQARLPARPGGGEVLRWTETDDACLACMLGGPDGRRCSC